MALNYTNIIIWGIIISKHNERILPAHVIVQSFSSFSSPTQSFPPFSGSGLLHSRVRISFPFMLGHFALHSVHEDHVPQPPSTEKCF